MMAKPPKGFIPIKNIKIDEGFRRNLKIVRDFPDANRSQVTEELEEMLFDKAARQDSFIGGRSAGSFERITKQILVVLKANPDNSAKELHKKCEEKILNFDMKLETFKTRISELRTKHKIPKNSK